MLSHIVLKVFTVVLVLQLVDIGPAYPVDVGQ